MTYILFFTLGCVVGAWAAWERFLRRERPEINLHVTYGEIERSVVEHWLDRRRLTWQPKGVDFKHERKRP